MLVWAIAIAGGAAVLVAWALVRHGAFSVWVGLGGSVGAAAVASLATGKVRLSTRVGWGWSSLAGVGAGLGLYLATAVFVLLVRRTPIFDRHVAELYGQRRGLFLPSAFAVAFLVSGGEEIFWRGLVQGRLSTAMGTALGALVAWSAYVVANLPSGSLPIVAGAVVGGAVWTLLAWWTGGVLASLLCHTLWTGLMLVAPPGGAQRRTPQPAGRDPT